MKSRFATAVFATAVLSLLMLGCHRGYYRRQADAEAAMLLQQKADDPRWNSISSSIEIDPRSRMFDPFSADHPPLPPDDPVSHELMEFVDCKRNYPHWHANGDTCYVENPEWTYYLPINEKGELVLDLHTAVKLAMIHSVNYQSQQEELYLSALDVSLQRFGFDSQLLLSLNGDFRSNGRLLGGANNLTSGNNTATLNRLGITGTTLAVSLANSIIWNFAGVDTQSASTLINFSLVQPLLRAAGRDRIMESLTQSERTLLANVRQMERFRRGFYLNVTTGRSTGAGPSRAGNFLGLPSAANANAGGFLGLLTDLQEIRIQERNVKDQEEVLEQFRAFFQEQRIDLLQVTQIQSNLYRAQRALAQSRNAYQNSLDQFKQTLGIPPDVPVVIEDPFLDQFELISDVVNQRRDEINALREQTSVSLSKLNAFVESSKFDADPAQDGDQFGLRWSDDISMFIDELLPVLESIEPIRQKILETVVEEVEADFDVLDSARPERLSSLQRLRELVAENPDSYDIDQDILNEDEVAETEVLRRQLEETLAKIEQLASRITQTIDKANSIQATGRDAEAQQLYNDVVLEVLRVAPELMTDLSNYLLEISLIQARARTDSILLPDVDLSWERAIAIARCFRRDWMNARASLVDQWRNIEFVADDLESQLDIIFEGDVRNNGDNPLNLQSANGSLGVGLRWDAPITRVSERNAYRGALISYQQARRQYYQFKDEVKRNLRQSIRQLELSKILFELDRRSIRIAVQEVELARFALEEPPEVRTALGSQGGGLGSQTALNLTNALNSLQQTQNTMLNTWVNFETQRRGLDFDLGTMQLTPDGYWLDPGQIDKTIATRAAELMGIPCESVSCEIDPWHVDYNMAEMTRGYNGAPGEELAPDVEPVPQGNSAEPLPINGGLLDPRSETELNPPNANRGASSVRRPGREAILQRNRRYR